MLQETIILQLFLISCCNIGHVNLMFALCREK